MLSACCVSPVRRVKSRRNALLWLSPPCATVDAVESLRHADSNAPARRPGAFFLRDLCALGVMLFVLMGPGVAVTKEWEVIRFGVDPSYPPFESKAPDGNL